MTFIEMIYILCKIVCSVIIISWLWGGYMLIKHIWERLHSDKK